MMESFDEESDLMFAIKNGSRIAFEKLYNLYKKPLANYIYRLCWDKNLAEDILQDVFLHIWKGAKGYRREAKVSTYIFRIAHNIWISHSRRIKKSSEIPIYFLQAKTENPLLTQELNIEVKKALNELSPIEKEVIILSQYNGLRYDEISEILDIPLGTVKSRLASALSNMHKRLEKYIKED
jgi:RNA polymerase sigma-70 factor (ECF subfamily)